MEQTRCRHADKNATAEFGRPPMNLSTRDIQLSVTAEDTFLVERNAPRRSKIRRNVRPLGDALGQGAQARDTPLHAMHRGGEGVVESADQLK